MALQATAIYAQNDEIHVAYAGPVTGSSGQSLIQSVQLYFDQVNANGGIDDRKIVLDLYDDQNSVETARRRAEEIVDSNAVAVIGHWYSSCSLAAKPIYDEAGIPVLTFSTHDAVTMDNDVFFRTVYNNSLQGRFLANYAIKILNVRNVAILHGDQEYETGLKETFFKSIEKLGGTVTYVHPYQTGNADDQARQRDLAENLKREKSIDLIFLASQAEDAVPLVKRIRDLELNVEIMGPGSLTDSAFISGFDDLPVSRSQQLGYTDRIYVSSPLIFDIANAKAQVFKSRYEETYGEQATSWGAYAYDNAMLLARAFRAKAITGNPADTSQERRRIKDFLQSLDSPEASVHGVTGLNYFDATGNSSKPLSIGQFKNGILVSAMTQLQGVRSKIEVFDINEALSSGSILHVDDRYMYRTNVVYTGVKLREISEWDLKTYSALVTFDLWFRMSGGNEIETTDIVFDTAAEPVRLGDPVEESRKNQILYRRYQVKGRFKLDPVGWEHGFEEHVVALSFKHKTLPRNRLIFVTDLVGMGLKPSSNISEKVLEPDLLNKAVDFVPKHTRLYQDISTIDAKGDPEFLMSENAQVQFSRFNVGVWLQPRGVSIRRSMPVLAAWIVTVALIMVYLVVLWQSKRSKPLIPATIAFISKSIIALLLLLSVETILIEYFLFLGKPIKRVFDILWWLVFAVIAHRAIDNFVFLPLQRKSERSIPGIITKTVGFIIYLLAVFGIIAFVFDQKITSLLATSGLMAMIIGLAIQVNIANIFSGIVINMEHPFRMGDWVQFDNFEEGKIIDISWRSTRLMTRKGNILSIPNSQASESVMRNYSFPYNVIWGWQTVNIPIRNDPDAVLKTLNEAVKSADGIREEPAPAAVYMGLSEWSNKYMVMYCYSDYQSKLGADESVWSNVWHGLQQAGITPAERKIAVQVGERMPDHQSPSALHPQSMLSRVPAIEPLGEEAVHQLSKWVKPRFHAKDATIVQHGKQGGSMIIIAEGSASVQPEGNTKAEGKPLLPGDAFGEINLFTGEPFTASLIALEDVVALEVTRDMMSSLLKDAPDRIDSLCEKLSVIVSESTARSDVHEYGDSTKGSGKKDLEKRVREFYQMT